MKRKIETENLRIGMYVADLDRPWLETPFLFQGFEIRSQDDLRQLQQYCRYVYVLDPEIYARQKASAAANARVTPSKPDPESKILSFEIEQRLLRINNHPGARSIYDDQTSLEEEIERIAETYREARALVETILADARLGKSIDMPRAKKVVASMAHSVIRNPDALTCFIQLKRVHEYTAQHSLRVCVLALIFGRQLGFDIDALNVLGLGALLHDIGKAKVPVEILDKPKALDAREIEIMKRHVPWGVEMLENTPGVPSAAIEVTRNHHERYDGSGYAEGLRGDLIGTFGMIGGIVDCYDAITSDRVYHQGMSPHQALKRMYEWRAGAFHPELVEQFIQCLGIYPVGTVVELNTREIGVVASLNRLRRLKPRVILVRRPDSTPYPMMAAVNLVDRKTPAGKPCDIERVLDPTACGINPAYFLPIPTIN